MAGYEEYWIKRANRRITDRQKYVDSFIMEIAGVYEEAVKELNQDINRLLLRFMTEENLTREEAKKLLSEKISAKELEDIRSRINGIVDEGIRKKLQNKLK
ncbi:MAG: hypothetical protein ACI4R5_00615, partial [Acetatifactor sp.]